MKIEEKTIADKNDEQALDKLKMQKISEAIHDLESKITHLEIALKIEPKAN